MEVFKKMCVLSFNIAQHYANYWWCPSSSGNWATTVAVLGNIGMARKIPEKKKMHGIGPVMPGIVSTQLYI